MTTINNKQEETQLDEITTEDVLEHVHTYFREIRDRLEYSDPLYKWMQSAAKLEWDVTPEGEGQWKVSISSGIAPGMGVWWFIEETGEVFPDDKIANQIIEALEGEEPW